MGKFQGTGLERSSFPRTAANFRARVSNWKNNFRVARDVAGTSTGRPAISKRPGYWIARASSIVRSSSTGTHLPRTTIPNGPLAVTLLFS
jgi:hypothetical protein